MKDLSIKKLYYSISEVSRITGLEQHVLRYWENEFAELKPSKNRAGNRVYTNKDIKTILQIKTLLKDSKYTIDGAKRILGEEQNEAVAARSDENSTASPANMAVNNAATGQPGQQVYEIKETLLELKNLLLSIQEKLS